MSDSSVEKSDADAADAASGGAGGFDRVAVVGAGTMGFGIALSYARQGADVALYDVDEDALAGARDRVARALDTLRDHGDVTRDDADDVADRIRYTDSLADAVGDAELVTEAVAEDLAVKREVFAAVDELAPADAVLATNTSGLSVTEIAEAVDDASRVLGTHWFNPPHVVPLVEVVTGEETDEALARAVYDYLDAAGKTPVLVRKEVPGFIGNRIQTAMAYEAFSLLEEGVASAEDIDRAVAAGFGFRLPLMGVFEKVDQSGLDVHHEVESNLLPELDRGTEPSATVADLVEAGHFGLKTGEGVYDWSDADEDELVARRDRRLLDLLAVYREADDPGR